MTDHLQKQIENAFWDSDEMSNIFKRQMNLQLQKYIGVPNTLANVILMKRTMMDVHKSMVERVDLVNKQLKENLRDDQ